MHARGGLKTKYFSDEWFSFVDECSEYAKQQGMQAWLYDENGWPSGFADRKLLGDKNNWSAFLKFDIVEKFPNIRNYESDNSSVFAIYYLENSKPIKIETDCGKGNYLIITKNKESSYVDVLNPYVSKQFIDIIYRKYKKQFANKLGKKFMPGFFTDEPQYFRYATPWSDVLPSLFEEKYGHTIFDVLPALFVEYQGDCEDRYEYWKLLSETYIENWIKPIYEWCDNNGCMLTGHTIEEVALFTQMWCTGGVMPFYQYEHIPGVDHLGRNVDSGLEAKQVGSVSAQLGKKRVLAEIFACTGSDATPAELKSIGDSMYVDGVNYMCHHLYPYSSRGERKYDHPTHFSDIMPWHDHLKEFNSYFDNLGCILSLGKDATDVLVLHPMHSAYLYYRREEDYDSIKDIEDTFREQLKELWSRHILFHLGDETVIKNEGRVDGNKFYVGQCVYKTVIIPSMETIDSTTLLLLKEYVDNGGKLLCLGKTPSYVDGKIKKVKISSNIELETVSTQNDIRIEYYGNNSNMLKWALRKNGDTNIAFVTNLTDSKMENINILCKGNVFCLTSDFKDYKSISGNTFSLNAHESIIVIIDEEEVKSGNGDVQIKEQITKKLDLEIKDYPENMLLLDYACVSYDGIEYGETLPVVRIRQILLEKRYSGRLWLKFNFETINVIKSLMFVSEPQTNLIVTINGASAKQSDASRIDRSLKCFDIASKTQIGLNEIVVAFDYYQNSDIYSVYFGNGTESLRNCMAFDTEIDVAYLFGDFSVDTSKSKWKQTDKNVLSYSGSFKLKEQTEIDNENITMSGYPFFSGKIDMTSSFYTESKNISIKLKGRPLQ